MVEMKFKRRCTRYVTDGNCRFTGYPCGIKHKRDEPHVFTQMRGAVCYWFTSDPVEGARTEPFKETLNQSGGRGGGSPPQNQEEICPICHKPLFGTGGTLTSMEDERIVNADCYFRTGKECAKNR